MEIKASKNISDVATILFFNIKKLPLHDSCILNHVKGDYSFKGKKTAFG